MALDGYVHRLLVVAHGRQRYVLQGLLDELEVLANGTAAADAASEHFAATGLRCRYAGFQQPFVGVAEAAASFETALGSVPAPATASTSAAATRPLHVARATR